jgi:hypothetical protein
VEQNQRVKAVATQEQEKKLMTGWVSGGNRAVIRPTRVAPW